MPKKKEKSKLEIMMDMFDPIIAYCKENKKEIQFAVIAGDKNNIFAYVDGTVGFISSLIVATDSPVIKHIANVATAKMLYENALNAEKLAFAPNPETEN
jgi:hypothetical protein